ncbi:MAG: 8-oxoguanine DNA glycosylase, N-terminal domain-containing protein [Calditrichota bacterium]
MNQLHLSMPFHLQHTLESGQFFQWERRDGGYIIQSHNRVFYIEQHNATLTFEPLYGACSKDFIRSFFRLDDDLTEIFKGWDSDALLPVVYTQFAGLRLMRQHPWECMVSFLCSAASNIPRSGNYMMPGWDSGPDTSIHW